MFKKTVDGVKNFLEKAFGKKNKKFSDKLAELPKERQEAIHRRAQELAEEAGELLTGGPMRMSREGKAMLTYLEGICLTKYKCSSGVWTVGVGATGTEIKDIKNWPMDKAITVQEAFELLDKSLHRYERAIRKALKVDVPQHAFDALVSWCYNVGIGWAHKATVIKLINKGVPTSDRRVYSALMRYKKPAAIIGRRKKEAKLLTKGKYAGNMKANLCPVSRHGKPLYGMGKTIDLNKYL